MFAENDEVDRSSALWRSRESHDDVWEDADARCTDSADVSRRTLRLLHQLPTDVGIACQLYR